VIEQSGEKAAVGQQLSSPGFALPEQSMVGAERPREPYHGRAGEAQKPEGAPSPVTRPGTDMGRSLAQILIVLAGLLVLVNIPLNYRGAGLAQLKPDAASVVLYDGLLLKGSGPEIYRLEEHKLRWISPEAMTLYFRQHKVQVVEDTLLEEFGKGQPIRRLVRCQDSPTIYALESGQKRWVKGPPPENQAEAWDQVRLVSCEYLRRLPVGLPILEDTEPLR